MFVATLLTNPATSKLDPATVESVRNAWGGGNIIWLDPDVAAEFSMGASPENLWDVWESLQAMGVDLVVQPAEARKKRLLIADMDSTMIEQECIDELADEAGVGPRVAEITVRSMNGELDFIAALQERVSLLKGLPETTITKVLDDRITYTPGGRTLLATMKAHGAYALLVSGGFISFAKPVSRHLGFDEAHANQLTVQNGHLTGKVAEPILGRDTKAEVLRETCTRLDLTPSDAIAVGDGANDLGMLGLAGMGVALHAKPSVAAKCDIRINHGDLTALLYIQGYTRSDFSTE